MTGIHRHALVIGKFYPPHRGHHRLIGEARRFAEQVSVVVMASGAESVPLSDRVAWLTLDHQREPVRVAGVQCEAPVDVDDAHVWAAQVAAIQTALRTIDAPPVDLVVSAEQYGPELAARLSAIHQPISRHDDPISATKIRADLAGHWDAITPITRAGLACRIVVLGAESTGTTTIAHAITAHYRRQGDVWRQTRTIPEYGRDYTHLLWQQQIDQARAAGRPAPSLNDVVWTADDFERIARRQSELENEAAREGSPLLVCDTDAFATAIWKRRYLGPSEGFPAWAQPPVLARHDLYLVTSHHEVPWIDDGIREGDLDIRAAMTDWFADALTTAGHPWVMLEGSLPERTSLALRSIEPVLDRRLHLADPLYGPGFPPPNQPKDQ